LPPNGTASSGENHGNGILRQEADKPWKIFLFWQEFLRRGQNLILDDAVKKVRGEDASRQSAPPNKFAPERTKCRALPL
jgi:hypothetical protein